MTHKHMLVTPCALRGPDISIARWLQLLIELEKRIKAVAKEACKQLEQLYPLEDWSTDTDECTANAVKSARAQELLASAGKK